MDTVLTDSTRRRHEIEKEENRDLSAGHNKA
jgi:hypothetical protein